METPQRRAVLRTLGGLGVATIAGCNGSASESDDRSSDGGTNDESETTDEPEAPKGSPPIDVSFLAKITADDADRDDHFGRSVALADGTALVGAPRDENPNGRGSGSAYVFQRVDGSWTQRQKLSAADGERGDGFGSAVALSGETLLVGAATADGPGGSGAGSAYVFEPEDDGWTQQARLVADEGERLDAFGESLALSGDTALVGASNHAGLNGADSGAVYVFERVDGSWTQQEKLAPLSLDRADSFGRSVALDGDTAVVGVPGDEDPNGGEAGSIYAFERVGGSWERLGRFAPEDGGGVAHFGRSVELAGDRAVVGAPLHEPEEYRNDDDEDRVQGAAYIFERADDDWIEVAKLVADDADGGDGDDVDDADRFGHSVGLAGAVAMIGAPRDEEPNGWLGGSAYVFQLVDGDWTQRAKVSARHGRPEDTYGWSVALSDGLGLAGVPREDLAEGHSSGAAHLYSLEEVEGKDQEDQG